MTARPNHRSTGRIFAWPLILGALSLAGLVAGLTGDGFRDIAAWALLGSTLVAIAHAFWRASRPVSSNLSNPKK